MKTTHILKILERTDFSNLSAAELSQIEIHSAECQRCRREFEAARIGAALLKSFAAEDIPPPPFFQSKVLNAWREQQKDRLDIKQTDVFRRWWQASATLVTTLILTVGGLILLAVLQQTRNLAVKEKYSADYNLYSTDSVIFDQNNSKDLTAEQAFEIIEKSKLTRTK